MMKKQLWTGVAIGLFVLGASNLVTGEIYQWTDARGVIHFTDNLSAVPDAVRRSPELVVRRDIETETMSAGTDDPLTEKKPTRESDTTKKKSPETVSVDSGKGAPAGVSYHSEPVTIVVVNSILRRPGKHPCHAKGNCQPAFRPDFNDRRHIHPSVFGGGARQYIHPR